jgi:ureidoacrylate peracid hydrolase
VQFRGQDIRPALVVIDAQNAFVSNGGSYSRLGINISNYQAMLPKLLKLVRECTEANIPVFYTLAVREASGTDLLTKTHKLLPRAREERVEKIPICVRGTWDADVIDEIKPFVNEENVILKRRDSSFHETDLDIRLRNLKIDTVVLCGVDTSICIETSLRDAFNLGYDVMLVSDASASMSPGRHQCTLDDVTSFYGPVLSADEFSSHLVRQPASERAVAQADDLGRSGKP